MCAYKLFQALCTILCYIAHWWYIAHLWYIANLWYIAHWWYIAHLWYIANLWYIASLWYIAHLWYIANLWYIASLWYIANLWYIASLWHMYKYMQYLYLKQKNWLNGRWHFFIITQVNLYFEITGFVMKYCIIVCFRWYLT